MSEVSLPKAELPVLSGVFPKLTMYFIACDIDRSLSQKHRRREKKQSDYPHKILPGKKKANQILFCLLVCYLQQSSWPQCHSMSVALSEVTDCSMEFCFLHARSSQTQVAICLQQQRNKTDQGFEKRFLNSVMTAWPVQTKQGHLRGCNRIN